MEPPHGRGKAEVRQYGGWVPRITPAWAGKDSGTVHGCGQLRITPAWAGKSHSSMLSCSDFWDHPRVGGEKVQGMVISGSMMGSPPHGRGKAGSGHCHRASRRITPAHAGKRTRSWRAYGCPWDHPRAGGEKANGSDAPDDDEGSPPRRRGKVLPDGLTCPVPWITPA